jgi:hypothetical protein
MFCTSPDGACEADKNQSQRDQQAEQASVEKAIESIKNKTETNSEVV